MRWQEKVNEMFPFGGTNSDNGYLTIEDIINQDPDYIVLTLKIPIRQGIGEIDKYIYYPDGTVECYELHNHAAQNPPADIHNFHIYGDETLRYWRSNH